MSTPAPLDWGLYTRTIAGWSDAISVYFNSQVAAKYEVQTHTPTTQWLRHAQSPLRPIDGPLQKHTLYGLAVGTVVYVRVRALDASGKPISEYSNVDDSMTDAAGTPHPAPTSMINALAKAYADSSSGTWIGVENPQGEFTDLGTFTYPADAHFAELAKLCCAEFLPLYDVAAAINARSVLGFTYLRSNERKTLAALIAKLAS